MKIQLMHCKLQLQPSHRIDLRGYNCHNTQVTKLQRVSDYDDDVRLYEFYCPGCKSTIWAWTGIDFRGKASPLIKIQPSHMKIWNAWIQYKNIVDPSGLDIVLGSDPQYPHALKKRAVV